MMPFKCYSLYENVIILQVPAFGDALSKIAGQTDYNQFGAQFIEKLDENYFLSVQFPSITHPYVKQSVCKKKKVTLK